MLELGGMDPQSVAFQPRDDLWRFQSEMLRVQESQAELADRVARLERKQEDDSRLKNVWGASSPFPSVLGGTPQQGTYGTKVCTLGPCLTSCSAPTAAYG